MMMMQSLNIKKIAVENSPSLNCNLFSILSKGQLQCVTFDTELVCWLGERKQEWGVRTEIKMKPDTISRYEPLEYGKKSTEITHAHTHTYEHERWLAAVYGFTNTIILTVCDPRPELNKSHTLRKLMASKCWIRWMFCCWLLSFLHFSSQLNERCYLCDRKHTHKHTHLHIHERIQAY